jgi:3-phosphoshikimate 1-carboxyvinyltransferase
MEAVMRLAQEIDGEFFAPPSKSFTHRALIAAALAEGRSVIRAPLHADDTAVTVSALSRLGIRFGKSPEGCMVEGTGGVFLPAGPDPIDMRDSGTSLRLLIPVALLSPGPVEITGSTRMRERPVDPLVDALNRIGGEIRYGIHPGFPPVIVRGHLRGGHTTISSGVSSQFISSLLLSAPYMDEGLELEVTGDPVSAPYIDITLATMKAFGADVERDGYRAFRVESGRRYSGRDYRIEGDYSSASYFFAIAAICRGRVRVGNLNPQSVQGDRLFLDILAHMGCAISWNGDTVTVERSGKLNGVEIDMSSLPDVVQTLCMVAAVADTSTTITGIGHLRHKESDRLEATATLLRGLGAGVRYGPDHLAISPSSLHGGRIATRNDHRIAMSFALLGLAVPGIIIEGAECTGKSFPGFFDILREAGLCG